MHQCSIHLLATLATACFVASVNAQTYTATDLGTITWTSIATTGELLPAVSACDDCTEVVPLPFPFDYFGRRIHTVRVSSNGQINMDASADSYCCGPVDIPSSGDGNHDGSYVAKRDLNPSAEGEIYVQLDGVGGCRTLTIEFHDVVFFGSTAAVNAQVVFYERPRGQIDLRWGPGSIPPGFEVSAGIENRLGINGTPAVAGPGFGATGRTMTWPVNRACRFDRAQRYPRVLSYTNTCGGSGNLWPGAVARAGGTLVEAPDEATFQASADVGSFDVLVLDVYTGVPALATLDALEAHALAGGRVIVNFWGLFSTPAISGHSLFTSTCPVTIHSEYTTPEAITPWLVNHPLLSEPNDISGSLAPSLDNCFTDGQRLTPTMGGSIVMGYGVPSPANGAMILSPNRRVILNGFAPGLFPPSVMEPLLENLLLFEPLRLLKYSGSCGGSPNASNIAAVRAGAEIREAATQAEFTLVAGEEGWDVLVFDEYGSTLTDTSQLDRMLRHAQNGNRVILSYYNLAADPFVAGHPLVTTQCPVNFSTAFLTPMPVHSWDPSHPVWSWPASIPTPIATAVDPCLVDGVTMNPLGGTIALAGYTPAPMANEAAIVMSADETVLLNGFIPGTMDLNPVADLIANQILFSKGCSQCATLCGDCNGSGGPPDVLDSLAAAQVAVGIISPTPAQSACCDVDSSGAVVVVDALRIAQSAAGLSVILTCP